MNLTELTTARWELLNTASGMSSESERILLDVLNQVIGYPAPEIGEVGGDNSPIAGLPDLQGKAKVALCVGHARPNDKGAYSTNGISEQVFNGERALSVKKKLEAAGIDVHVISFYEGGSYKSAMLWLAQYLKRNGYTHAFEFHFNSATPSVKGYEYLFWHLSRAGKVMAKVFQDLHGEFFPGAYDRGVEPLGDQAHERGVLFTSLTHCPAIILEPFFGSNAEEVARYMSTSGKEELDCFYSYAIIESIKALSNEL